MWVLHWVDTMVAWLVEVWAVAKADEMVASMVDLRVVD